MHSVDHLSFLMLSTIRTISLTQYAIKQFLLSISKLRSRSYRFPSHRIPETQLAARLEGRREEIPPKSSKLLRSGIRVPLRTCRRQAGWLADPLRRCLHLPRTFNHQAMQEGASIVSPSGRQTANSSWQSPGTLTCCCQPRRSDRFSPDWGKGEDFSVQVCAPELLHTAEKDISKAQGKGRWVPQCPFD